MAENEKELLIDRFVTETQKLIGKEIHEKKIWNTHVSEDSICHFMAGIGDDNPLYIDPDYSRKGPLGRLSAPPAFLASVLYPVIHGAPVHAPLLFLIGEVKYQWFLPLISGDNARAAVKLIDIYDTKGPLDERKIFIIAEACYLNQNDLVVGKCISTTVCLPENDAGLLLDRQVYKYSDEEIEKIAVALEKETRTGDRKLNETELTEGYKLPIFVRPPLSIADMICWLAAIGPSVHTGAPGFRENIKSYRTLVKHPVTGWPVSSDQQHEDFLLAAQRGMPLPFDHGVMRWACLSPMITNWMGDNGFLNSLSMRVMAPVLYGDTTWYHGEITERSDYDNTIFLKLKISGINQLGETTSEAEAGVSLPKKGMLKIYSSIVSQEKFIKKQECKIHYRAVDFFENQAAKCPDATALISGETRLTYNELDNQADLVACNLQSMGVGPNKTTAICMDRTYHYIIAILGILKTGGAFVPMDPRTPITRLNEMISDCEASVLITDDQSANMFHDFSGKAVSIASLQNNIGNNNKPDYRRDINCDDLAYIMYTSGSTGKAKGVAVTQGNLSTYISELTSIFDIDNSDTYLHSASFSFSASVRQIFLPLCSGAALVVADTEQRWDPIAMAELIKKEAVTYWDTVPSFFSLCCDAYIKLGSTKVKELLNNRLRYILLTGEPLTWVTPSLWYQKLGHPSKIVNLYSQTETSGTVCLYSVPQDSSAISGVVQIGHPTPCSAVYILDENNRHVLYGEIGEIGVAGPRISKGYLNLPELTATKFITNPFSTSGSLLYKTGDLGCYLPDGSIATKGRKDRRVKIRGFRVELEEIENVLRKHSEIKQTVVVVSNENKRIDQLLAYFVSKEGSALNPSELRIFMQSLLPDYMQPSHYIKLDKIPLNANGKVNYRELPAPDSTRPELNNTLVPPGTSVEKVVTDIWSDILGLDTMGIHDNFFELGGHSLSATRMLFKVRDWFHLDIPLRSIFENPTVAGISLLITQGFVLENQSGESVKIIDELEKLSDEEAQKLLEDEMKN